MRPETVDQESFIATMAADEIGKGALDVIESREEEDINVLYGSRPALHVDHYLP